MNIAYIIRITEQINVKSLAQRLAHKESSVQDNTAEKEEEQQGGEGLIQDGLDHGSSTQNN